MTQEAMPTREHCGNMKHRMSPDRSWPLRGVDGLTYAERKAAQFEIRGEEQCLNQR